MFDTWGGILHPQDYERIIMPGLRRIWPGLKGAGVPRVYFLKGSALPRPRAHASTPRRSAWTGRSTWRSPPAPTPPGPQGNLDPLCLFGSHEEIRRRAPEICRASRGAAGHVFNLGHGILPEAPIAAVETLVATVRRRTARGLRWPWTFRATFSRSTTSRDRGTRATRRCRPGPPTSARRLPGGAAGAGRPARRRALALPAPALLRQALPLLRLQRRRLQRRRRRRRLPSTASSELSATVVDVLGPGRRVAAASGAAARPTSGRTTRSSAPWACCARRSPSTRGARSRSRVDPRIGTP
ncbi:MAG: hypothetical protein IPM94_14020 [bacterium]|nr:hypothetical protein [bacterium]